MAVDYLARKAAKQSRKRDALAPKRERKKKQARRLCRGPCYQEPHLRPEDLEDEPQRGSVPSSGRGELAKCANLAFDAPQNGRASKEVAGAVSKSPQEQQANRKRKRGPSQEAAADGEEPRKERGAPRRLSTAVNLLDPATAKGEAPRVGQLPLSALSTELLQLPDLLQQFMAGEGFAEGMPIQLRCWPALLAGRDVEATAEPGSGKTLAYLLPAAVLLANKGEGAATQPAGPLALVLLPTRELAQQVAGVCRSLRRYTGLRTCCVTGGVERQQQVEALSKKPHIVVATPGRLLDLAQDDTVQLGHVRYVVFDEADKMLGLGFRPQIEQLKPLLMPAAPAGKAPSAKKKPRRVQCSLFTATMPESLAEVAAGWLHKPERIRVSASAASISRTVVQTVHVCAEHKKPAKLLKHLAQIQEAAKGQRVQPRTLVFANQIKTVRFLHTLLSEAGYRAAMLHGERSQEERDAALLNFRSGKAQVLVATDVAARGLHVRGLRHLVNYSFPPDLATYIHRVGRTGRLAADGHAFSFFTREMARLAPALLDLLQQHGQAIDPNLERLAEAWRIAAQKLGMVADAAGEAQALPQREDVLWELGMKSVQQKKRERQAQRQSQQTEEAGAEGGSSEEDGPSAHNEAGLGGESLPGEGQPVADANVPPDEAEPPPSFVPSRQFVGARPGYAFKKGARGQGYYLDPVQQLQQQEQRQRGKRARAAAPPGKQQQGEEWRQLKQRYSHAPIGGRDNGDAAKPAVSAKARRAQAAQQAQQAPAKQQALLPGRLKELKRARQAAAAAGQLAGFSSDEEGAAQEAPRRKRPGAIPGRLRKKLAKARSAGGAD